MQALTLILSFVLSCVVFVSSPVNGLLIFFAGMIWYPNYFISAGSIDLTLRMFLIMTLLLTLFIRSKKLRSFKWCNMDTFVVLLPIAKLISLSTTSIPPEVFLVREAGQLFTMTFPYFIVRMTFTSKAEMIHFLKNMVFIALPMPFLGLYESITGFNPFSLIGVSSRYIFRGYMYRSNLSFEHSILYGLTFAAISIICLGLKNYLNWSLKKTFILCSILVLGVITSNSSGPLFAFVASLGFIAIYPFKRFSTLIIIFIISSLVFIEFYSNRHWYEVLTRFAGSGETAYYRIGLINEAFGGGMTDHWLFGFGYVGLGPGNFNENFHWVHRDMVNIYIYHLVYFGLVGLIPFLAINITFYRKLRLAYKRARQVADRWFIWCFTSAILGWNIALMTVAAMGAVNTMMYIYIGLCVNLPTFITQSERNEIRR